jgi:hypothetical protein
MDAKVPACLKNNSKKVTFSKELLYHAWYGVKKLSFEKYKKHFFGCCPIKNP